jgi:hypothetical protein
MRSRFGGLASSSAALGRTGRKSASRPRPFPQSEQPLLGGRRLVDVPLRPAHGRERVGAAAASSTSSVRAVRWASVEAPPRPLLDVDFPARREQLARGPHDLGPDGWRAAMLRQRGAPLASRFLAARVLASGPLRRSARRAGFAVAATTLLVLAMAPALLVVSVLLKLF